MLQLNSKLELFQEKLEHIDVLDVRDVSLDADVDLQARLHVLHREVVVRFTRIRAFWLQDDWEERHLLSVVVDLQPIEHRLVNPLVVFLANHADPIVQDYCQHFSLFVNERDIDLAYLKFCPALLLLNSGDRSTVFGLF